MSHTELSKHCDLNVDGTVLKSSLENTRATTVGDQLYSLIAA